MGPHREAAGSVRQRESEGNCGKVHCVSSWEGTGETECADPGLAGLIISGVPGVGAAPSCLMPGPAVVRAEEECPAV